MTSTLQELWTRLDETRLRRRPATAVVGWCALAFSVVYFASDVLESADGGFTRGQLWLTLFAEAAVPLFVLGLAAVQRPALGRLGELSAWAYAGSYVAFTGTVVYALVQHTPDYSALSHDLGPLLLAPGAVMVLAGVGFSLAVRRAHVLPLWTAMALGSGVILVAAAQDLPDAALLVAAGIRDLGFAGMGAALLTPRRNGRVRRTGDS